MLDQAFLAIYSEYIQGRSTKPQLENIKCLKPDTEINQKAKRSMHIHNKKYNYFSIVYIYDDFQRQHQQACEQRQRRSWV